jgi:hypothetical protein
MALTPSQRSRINTKNAAHSKGPTSAEGKKKAARNSLRHGLRAKKLALDHEEPRRAQARGLVWGRFYRPQTPAQQFALDTAVEATILLDRCSEHLHGTLNKQVREAEQRWDQQREDHVAELTTLLETDPAAAVRGLNRTAHGCRWLIAQWEVLLDCLELDGTWGHADCTRAIRLKGYDPQSASDPYVFYYRAYNLLARREPGSALDDLLRHTPLCLRNAFNPNGPHGLPNEETSRGWLAEQVEAELAQLRPREQKLYELYDAPDRAEAVGRALVPYDGPEARLFLRYRTTYEMAYYRAVKGLKELEEQALAEGRGLLPNEPNTPLPESQAFFEPESCGANLGRDSETLREVAGGAEPVEEPPLTLSGGLDPAWAFGTESVAESRTSEPPVPLLPPSPEREPEPGAKFEDAVARDIPPATRPLRPATAVGGTDHNDVLPNEPNGAILSPQVPFEPKGYGDILGTVSDPPAAAWLDSQRPVAADVGEAP